MFRVPQFGSLNHRGLARRNASEQAPVGRYREEADISEPTITAGTVENDPERTSALPFSKRTCFSIRSYGLPGTGLFRPSVA